MCFRKLVPVWEEPFYSLSAKCSWGTCNRDWGRKGSKNLGTELCDFAHEQAFYIHTAVTTKTKTKQKRQAGVRLRKLWLRDDLIRSPDFWFFLSPLGGTNPTQI